jgi:ABC-type amino acid transport substrate-binding protein
LRTVKFSLLIASVALLCIYCGSSQPAPDAWKAIAKNKMVRIGTNPFNIPFETANGTGVEGFDIDLGEAIVKDLGYPAKWIQWQNFTDLFDLLKKGEIEMIISSVAISDERKKDFAFSDPYFETSNTIARRADNTTITDLASLAGKHVGVQTGRSAEAFMATQTTAGNVTVVKFATLDEALGALNRGEIEAVVGYKPIMTYSIAKNYSTNLITTDVDLSRHQYAVVVRPEETKLLEKINETIRRLKGEKQFEAWHDKWFGTVLIEGTKAAGDAKRTEELKIAPKSISVTLVKEPGSTYELDRLDGFNATLTGPGGNFTSTAINTNEAGTGGTFKFPTPIPPGEYKFNLARIKVSENITIQKEPKTSLSVTMTFGVKSLSIVVK